MKEKKEDIDSKILDEIIRATGNIGNQLRRQDPFVGRRHPINPIRSQRSRTCRYGH